LRRWTGGGLPGIRDRARLLVGFAGGLRRSEITGLDLGRDQKGDGRGWIEILHKGLLITLHGKTGWREVEVGRGSSDATCPVIAIETWIKFAKRAKGPLFRRVNGKGKKPGLIGSTIRKWRVWSSAQLLPLACGAICQNTTGRSGLQAIRYAPGLLHPRKSTSAVPRSSLAMPAET